MVWGVASIVPEPCVELHRLLIDDTTGPVRAPLLPLDDAATSELAALLDGARLSAA